MLNQFIHILSLALDWFVRFFILAVEWLYHLLVATANHFLK